MPIIEYHYYNKYINEYEKTDLFYKRWCSFPDNLTVEYIHKMKYTRNALRFLVWRISKYGFYSDVNSFSAWNLDWDPYHYLNLDFKYELIKIQNIIDNEISVIFHCKKSFELINNPLQWRGGGKGAADKSADSIRSSVPLGCSRVEVGHSPRVEAGPSFPGPSRVPGLSQPGAQS